MRPLTVGKLKKACLDNKYLLLRCTDGSIYGHNGKIAKIAFKPHGNKLTQYISYIPCCINEYINYKVPFQSSVMETK